MSEMSLNDIACEILRATRDGEDLAPKHLKLVEAAVNGFLNEQGEVEFYKLRDSVRKGYTKPWFHGIEHLAINHEGFVFWKGQEVEHYTLSWAYSDEAKRSAEEIARRCRVLEVEGVTPTTRSVIWDWREA